MRAALGVAGLAVAGVLLPVPGAAQPARLSGLTCTTSDVLNVTVTKGDREMTVTWDAVDGVASYDVSWSPASDGGATGAQVQGTLYTITGLSNIVEYTVAVQADTTLTCSATVPTEFPPCPTASLDASVTPGDTHLTVYWDPVTGVTEYELGWSPAASDGRRATVVQDPQYTIDGLRNDVRYLVTLGAGPDNVCVVHGTPVGNNAESDSESSGGGDDSDSDGNSDSNSGNSGGSGGSGGSGDGQDDDDPVPVPAIPFAGLVGLAVALMGGGILRRRPPGAPESR